MSVEFARLDVDTTCQLDCEEKSNWARLVNYACNPCAELTSLPVCWDTRRAGTNEGYFDFQHFAFFAHPDNRCKFISAIY
jgi:hypothetical protein